MNSPASVGGASVAATVGLASGTVPSVGVAGRPVASIAKGVTVATGGGVEVGWPQAARRRARRSRRRKVGGMEVWKCGGVDVASIRPHLHTSILIRSVPVFRRGLVRGRFAAVVDDFAGLGAGFGGADDALFFEDVDEAGRAGVADAQAALEQGDGGLLHVAHGLDGFFEQLVVALGRGVGGGEEAVVPEGGLGLGGR